MLTPILRAMRKRQEGQVLLLLLIIFAFCSLCVVPILSFMATGVITARDAGLHTQEIYAAEAGVRDAIWKIQRAAPGLPKQQSDPPLSWNMTVEDKPLNPTLNYGVHYDVYYVEPIGPLDPPIYRVQSVANPNTGHPSRIDSDVEIKPTGGLDLSAFTRYALTSPGTISTKTSDTINGDVWIQSSGNYTGAPPTGSITVAPVTGWPTESLLETYFSYQVDKSSPYSSGTINVSQPGQSGPLYAHGYSNENYTITGTYNLTGVIYVDCGSSGRLYFDQNAHINLNGYSIFVTGNIDSSTHSYISGPGAIIGLGNIAFQPNVSPSYIFVMSVSGQVNLQPQGNFVGAVAGDTNVNLQPNCTLTWQDPGVGNLDVPGLYNSISMIKTWKIH
jgi:hypothetical protein